MDSVDIAPFRPHLIFRGGHSQTMLAAIVAGSRSGPLTTTEHHVTLPDGDRLVLHDDAAELWQPGDPVVLLVHGMCGSSESSYMQRISRKLTARGRRTFRLNLRGCGAGSGLARLPYHAGRSDDLQATAELIRLLAPGSPVSAVGFSLGGNIVLKWLGEQVEAEVPVTRAMAVNPPVNLEACTEHVRLASGGLYDRHFARLLFRHVRSTPHWRGKTALCQARRRPRRIIDFDELFTAPLAGYRSAQHYYRACSAAPLISQIKVPTLVLSAKNDPLIPSHVLESMDPSDYVTVHIAEGGGHLGYIGRSGNDPDCHWMDWRVIDWLSACESSAAA